MLSVEMLSLLNNWAQQSEKSYLKMLAVDRRMTLKVSQSMHVVVGNSSTLTNSHILFAVCAVLYT